MTKAIIASVLILPVIIGTILVSGCIATPATNTTTATPVVTPTPQRPNIVSVDTVPVSGQVLIEGEPAAGVLVIAAAIDGNDTLSTDTNLTGEYTLHIKRGKSYNFTALNKEYNYVIWPVFFYKYSPSGADRINFNLTKVPKSTITGFVTSHHILIEATPVEGGPTMTTMNGYNYTYSLNLEPGITYKLGGGDYYGQYQTSMHFKGRNGRNPGNLGLADSVDYNQQNTITLSPNETALIDLDAYITVH